MRRSWPSRTKIPLLKPILESWNRCGAVWRNTSRVKENLTSSGNVLRPSSARGAKMRPKTLRRVRRQCLPLASSKLSMKERPSCWTSTKSGPGRALPGSRISTSSSFRKIFSREKFNGKRLSFIRYHLVKQWDNSKILFNWNLEGKLGVWLYVKTTKLFQLDRTIDI